MPDDGEYATLVANHCDDASRTRGFRGNLLNARVLDPVLLKKLENFGCGCAWRRERFDGVDTG